MNKIITNAILGSAVALTAVILGACNETDDTNDRTDTTVQEAPQEETKPCWGDYEDDRSWMFDESLTYDQADMVMTGCTFSTLAFEEPVTLNEIEQFALYYSEQEACAWATTATERCEYVLNHELTLEEVRNG